MPRSVSDFGYITVLLVSLSLALCLPGTVAAADTQVVLLAEAVKRAVQQSPQIKEEQWVVLVRRSQRRQADAARFAQLDPTVVDGLSPRARGNQIGSLDSKGALDFTAMFGRVVFSIMQPSTPSAKLNIFGRPRPTA